MLSTVCPSEGGINVVKLIPSSFDFVFFLGKWEPRLYCKKSSQEPITSKSLRSRAPSPPPPQGGGDWVLSGEGLCPWVGKEGGCPDFKWRGWSNGCKNPNPEKIPGRDINPQKNSRTGLGLFTELRGHCPRNIKTKNTGQTFLPKQKPRIKNFKPPKRLWSSPVTWNPEHPSPPGTQHNKFGDKNNISWPFKGKSKSPGATELSPGGQGVISDCAKLKQVSCWESR